PGFDEQKRSAWMAEKARCQGSVVVRHRRTADRSGAIKTDNFVGRASFCRLYRGGIERWQRLEVQNSGDARLVCVTRQESAGRTCLGILDVLAEPGYHLETEVDLNRCTSEAPGVNAWKWV